MKQYEVTFWDGTSVKLDAEKGEHIYEIWMESENRSIPFEVHGNGYMLSDVKRMEQVFSREQQTERQLSPGEKPPCKSQRSIQREIHQLIAKNYGDEWPLAVKDKKLREDMRQQLWEVDKNWCDAKAGTCVCNKSYAPVDDMTIKERLGL